MTATEYKDPHSFANLHQALVSHSHLDWVVNFDTKTIAGFVEHTIKFVSDNVNSVIFDTSFLEVKAAHVGDVELKFTVKERDPKFGSALHIQLDKPRNKGDEVVLKITYSTTPKSTALQWVAPSQTIGKIHPYLYSQCQAIHARALLPCMDTPANKLTYSATVESPHFVLMSALRDGEPVVAKNGSNKIYKFNQPQRMASYLIAITSGNIAGKQVGPRTTVWCEPEMLSDAAWEFEETDRFIGIIEDYLKFTPYSWGIYDLLILPPSFCYGGMENCCVTNVTPTLIAKDRSLVDVVCHELAHSWSGNLVTNASWGSFWLNEGYTMYLERKMIAALHGEPARHLSAIIGWKHLEEDVALFGETNPLTALCPNLNGVDPDDAFSGIPYEKGFNLLFYLETILGGSTVFDHFVRAYIAHFAGQSITTQDWKDFLYQWTRDNLGVQGVSILDGVDWDTWLFKPGMPPVTPTFDRTLETQSKDLAKKWDAARNESIESLKSKFAASDIASFQPLQKVVFLERLLDTPALPHVALQALGEIYGLAESYNAEIRFRYQSLCLKAEYEAIFPKVIEFITSQGRMKYVRPLYRALNKCRNGSALAKETFVKFQDFYHPIAAGMIKKDLSL